MDKKRRKLFSSNDKERRKLFSNSNELDTVKVVVCQDCGYQLNTTSSVTNIACPKCGGTRFNFLVNESAPKTYVDEVIESKMSEDVIPEEKVFSRRSLFGLSERAFSEIPENQFEENLRIYSGKELSSEDVEKNFSMSGQELIEKGFANISGDNNYLIHESSLLQSKLFAKLTITVTKQLELDPIDSNSRENMISSLGDNPAICSKGLMLIKRAHSPEPRISNFSEVDEWIKDSNIVGDLVIEFGGTTIDLDKFKEILEERYDDAPEGVIDALEKLGTLKVQGNLISIFK